MVRFAASWLYVGDAAATAHNILAHEPLYRLGFAAELISAVCYITVTLLLYDMFRPVNRSVSLLAAFFSLTGCTIQAFSTLFHLAPLVILGGEQYLSAFRTEQLQALALMFLNLRAQTSSIYMVFFGWYCLLIGYLIFRSTFLPRILGVFMAIAGLVVPALSVTTARKLSVPVRCETRRRSRGTVAHPVAARDGREQSTMEGAGERRGGQRMKAAVCAISLENNNKSQQHS